MTKDKQQPEWSDSKTEELLSIGWFIVALLAEDKHHWFAMIAAILAIFALVASLVFAWAARKARTLLEDS